MKSVRVKFRAELMWAADDLVRMETKSTTTSDEWNGAVRVKDKINMGTQTEVLLMTEQCIRGIKLTGLENEKC
jgi:hypothetical protein